MLPDTIQSAIVATLQGDLVTALNIIRELSQHQPENPWITAVDRLIVNEWVRRRQSKAGALQRLSNLGFKPSSVIDVGAQIGTHELYETFPHAQHLFVEPVAECLPRLLEIKASLNHCEIEAVAASSRDGSASISISESLQYSTLGEGAGPIQREISVKTVNTMISQHKLPSPYLLKVDVDGKEIDVLKGATSVLNDQRSCLVIEATLCDGDPRFPRIMDFIARFQYRVFDIVDFLYRPNDQALWQVDLIALHETNTVFGKTSYQ